MSKIITQQQTQKQKPVEYTKFIAKANTNHESAREYVLKAYNVLIKHKYTPEQARISIQEDCWWWSDGHAARWLPPETKNQARRGAGLKSGKSRAEIRDQKIQETIEKIPSLNGATPQEQHMASRLTQHLSSYKFEIGEFELKQIVDAYRDSIMNNTYRCKIFVADGKFDHAEAE